MKTQQVLEWTLKKQALEELIRKGISLQQELKSQIKSIGQDVGVKQKEMIIWQEKIDREILRWGNSKIK